MANDFDCSIDFLINESMRFYARDKGYVPNQSPNQSSGQSSGQAPPQGSPSPRPEAGGVTDFSHRPDPHAGVTRPPPPPSAAMPHISDGFSPRGPGVNSGPAIDSPRGFEKRMPGSADSNRGRPYPAPPSGGYPPIAPSGGGRGAGASQGIGEQTSVLCLIFNGQRIPVDKDQFIIGRGSKSSDLPIKDGNISRKHAAIVRRNGAYYIKDLGSTNGIDFRGMRIDNKRIDEGDVFMLCDHELKFTYRG